MIIDAELDITPAYGWQGGPEFNTLIKSLRSGRERRRPLQEEARHSYTLPFQNITNSAYLQRLKGVFLVARGCANSFFAKDHSDYTAEDAFFGVGNGTSVRFPLYIQSVFGSQTYDRRILYPVEPVFYVNGVAAAASFDSDTKEVVFESPPAALATLTWSGEFRVLVRFESDSFPMTIDQFSEGQQILNGSVQLREVWE
jgi:uncharacterized protein (TIGR02217 family)